MLYCKGAPEVVLARCTWAEMDGGRRRAFGRPGRHVPYRGGGHGRVGFRWLRKTRCSSGAYRWTRSPHRDLIGAQARSVSNSSTSRYESERRYQPTARSITSGSNCRHLNRPQTEDAGRSIRPAYRVLCCALALDIVLCPSLPDVAASRAEHLFESEDAIELLARRCWRL